MSTVGGMEDFMVQLQLTIFSWIKVKWLASSNLWKFEFPHHLRQDNHGENVGVQWLMKNRIYVLSKAGQPRRECQCSVANEKSNLRTS